MPDAAGLIAKVLSDSPNTQGEGDDDAILDAIALSACADGVTNVELVAILRIARELPTMRDRPPAEIDERVHAAFDRLTADGLEGRLQALGKTEMDDATRQRMFCAAAVVQYADGQVTSSENEFLLDLADVLQLDDTTVRKIVADIELELGIERPADSV
jgi:tellurite resistance protein